ncbi:MAG: CDP-alcohol phosphatidyltransferase family protein [Deltaproteobacteria bacterium]|nr:CDP-alcohol phosphatidyltransferase family protein [Deltaproteobacteria bacterium]
MNIFSLADLLTTLRLLLVPVYVWCFVEARAEAAFWVFVVAGFTDVIDGTVARLLGKSTRLGSILDPIADKLLMGTCFITLTMVGRLPVWFLVLALTRDVILMGGIFYFEKIRANIHYRPLRLSKLATLCQLLTAGLALLFWWQPVVQGGRWGDVFWIALSASALLIAVSGVMYISQGIRMLATFRNNHERS